ncbi:hypothetical protein GF318_01925 [Candidatus Micrarchaeota archaeon]|nr:hypothetical protein [Candidatus Micrarchaeota archaeon]
MEENVKCDFCGKGTYCETCGKSPESKGEFRHMCFECFQKEGGKVEDKDKTHVCIPPEEVSKAYERFIGDVTQKAFSDLWGSEKKRLKELSKQEIARTCFFEGAGFMLEFMKRASKESETKE